MIDAWSTLAEEYARGRIGYAPELYDTIVQFGLQRGTAILDVGCGTGLAGEPFTSNGFVVSGVDSSPSMLAKLHELGSYAELAEGTAEALPFPNERFDAVISAQVFHWLERTRALAEAYRVMRRGAIIAIWWKHLMAGDAVKQTRDDLWLSLGKAPVASGLPGGFKEFYAAPFKGQTLRIIPWRTAVPLEQYMSYERSRKTSGDDADRYYAELEARLRERFDQSGASIPLSYIHYLYLAKTA